MARFPDLSNRSDNPWGHEQMRNKKWRYVRRCAVAGAAVGALADTIALISYTNLAHMDFLTAFYSQLQHNQSDWITGNLTVIGAGTVGGILFGIGSGYFLY